ncbi:MULTISPECIES: hypothetical protein [Klebsiella]|uniref:hypothetical protein n=1 Tax=Klebsiella TaxID=570 RepID=UPI000CD1FB10|nr:MULTISPECIES: hypothetical protein [Klebsiella]AUU89139.1 hypothetical protein C2U55_08595 [Enterobacteriaceae bacterium ENNIH3]AUV05550.1 hypothetical protein C2U52_04270 [Enterobacteriaceae bacterium ENNIH2]EKU9556507.1 hypothetical protein [Enterobacter roggenkampii MGH 34]MDU9212950.1 hypothetical protein [Klebsiella pneumoniae]UHC85923.1 hypothetical protein LUW95_18750 [Klebsiella michiganensis]
MALSIKLPEHVYAGLLAEAKRRGTTVPALTREVLAAAANLFDNGGTIHQLVAHQLTSQQLTIPGMGKHGENNNESKKN